MPHLQIKTFDNDLIIVPPDINKIQQDATNAGIYLLQNCSTCFGCLSYPT